MNTSNLWAFGFKSNEEKLATRQELNNLKLPPSPAVSLFDLNNICVIYREVIAALPLWPSFLQGFGNFRICCFICALVETVDSIEAELFIGEAQVSDSRLGSSTTRARVDDWVPNAAILQPASLTAVQKLKLPGCVQLTHFGHCRTISNTCLYRLCKIHFLETFEEIHFTWRQNKNNFLA